MANNVAITLNENNDEDVDVAITTNVPVTGTVLNLTGMTLEAYLKTSARTSDTDVTTWKGSTVTGEITVTDATNGLASIAIPASAVQITKGWWRCDVLNGGLRKSAVSGAVTVVDM